MELENGQNSRIDIESIPDELSFRVLGLGKSDNVKVVEHQDRNKLYHNNTLPLGTPPVFPSLHEDIKQHLLNPEAVPIHAFQSSQQFWESERNVENLFDLSPSPSQLSVQMERNPRSGKIENYRECISLNNGLTAENSMSLRRKPGAHTDSVKGESSNNPFLPGGMNIPNLETLLEKVESGSNISPQKIVFDKESLLSCAPSFTTSVTFDKKYNTSSGLASVDSTNILDVLSSDVAMSDLFVDVAEQTQSSDKESPVDLSYSVSNDDIPDDVLEVQNNVNEKEKKSEENKEKKVWAVLDDFSDTSNFHRQVPDMAFKYPFELDVFQKRAILHLEKHENILVAAHTSAGKTVVAEYAIALAQKHMRRAIYTSPIKALSNQKFRDFKSTFPEVGLLTGDVQIKPESSCLIMTTEILRSMLYNGSDVIRDLEWVIFDEIHYINDADRGVVWEEVLIMLPSHVGIILLSATVPNTVEFATWIGKTKQNKVFVVQTRKRPVPLEHHLYTGNSNKTSNELFLILDRNGKFIVEGYRAALMAKKQRASKADESYGPRGVRQGNPKQDRNVWLSVVQMLKKREQLPVVAFTLSKKKCDSNADMLRTVDLVTTTERSHIITFFNKSISRLKGSDRSLPQVLWLEDLLKVGIGVHHSGILPILKEIVEMLFQRGLVKLLFATETFAMGVNMPARTVVFDSTRKFDGNQYRDLLSSEYIQMAGRAGRRGLDTTGMVVLLCKGDVPETSDLHRMMLGTPTKLISQFRLTYYMILNLLRVKQLTVQDMMKRSFAEFFLQGEAPENEKKLSELRSKVKLLKDPDCAICAVDLKNYYLNWAEILQLRKEIKITLFSSAIVIKTLQAGRLVLVSNQYHKNALAVILAAGGLQNKFLKTSASEQPLNRLYLALILCDNELEESRRHDSYKDDSVETVEQNSSQDMFFDDDIFQPQGKPGQVVEEIPAASITHILDKTIKCDVEKIMENHKKRLIPRFRLDPPSTTTIKVGQDLYNFTEEFAKTGYPSLHPIKNFSINDIEFVQKYRALQKAESNVSSFACLQCTQFREHLAIVRGNVKMQKDIQELELKLSDESLELIEEYYQRIEVLKALNYIDDQKNLRHKGRVAFEINTHEVMITELLINNVLTDLHPAEIVAILSCFVFEMVVEEVKQTAERVAITQKQCGMDVTVESFLEQLHFGLVEVVYEWGCGMSFVEITKLTDVSEGNIVRCIQRLDETCRDVKKAAHVIGVQALCEKMEEGMSLIRRDIVFAASLYTS